MVVSDLFSDAAFLSFVRLSEGVADSFLESVANVVCMHNIVGI